MDFAGALAIVDTYGPLGLYIVVPYGFWRVVTALHELRLSLKDEFHAHEIRITKLEAAKK